MTQQEKIKFVRDHYLLIEAVAEKGVYTTEGAEIERMLKETFDYGITVQRRPLLIPFIKLWSGTYRKPIAPVQEGPINISKVKEAISMAEQKKIKINRVAILMELSSKEREKRVWDFITGKNTSILK